MTVLLVLATFLAFVVLDYLFSRRKAVQPAVAEAARTTPPVLQPAYVKASWFRNSFATTPATVGC